MSTGILSLVLCCFPLQSALCTIRDTVWEGLGLRNFLDLFLLFLQSLTFIFCLWSLSPKSLGKSLVGIVSGFPVMGPWSLPKVLKAPHLVIHCGVPVCVAGQARLGSWSHFMLCPKCYMWNWELLRFNALALSVVPLSVSHPKRDVKR